MKRILVLPFLSLFILPIYAQLNADHNRLRAGDVIIKQQVEFKDPLKAGVNLLWDFSQLHLINDEYELVYSQPPLVGDSVYVMGYNTFEKSGIKNVDLIVGTEHNTMYYFYQNLDSLLLIGHENVAVKQENLQPIINLKFPLNYGGIPSSSSYKARGLYSGTVAIQSEGNVIMFADAFGKMILPSGDTINPVVRVKTEQTILDISKDLLSDIENDKGRLLNSYRWYSKGYRYPIFETVECINLNTDSTLFSTAFYFPPQEHLYLDTDPVNLELLEKLWGFTDEGCDNSNSVDLIDSHDYKRNYKIYPNPVKDILNIEYLQEKDSPVNIIMATIDGKVVKNIFKKRQQAGDQFEQVDCSKLLTGVYLLKVVSGDVVINERIFKK